MPKVDFSKLKIEFGDFVPIPPGTHFCSLAVVEEASTENGDEIWKLKFLILEGPYRGRYLFDRMEFNDDGLPHIRFLCSRLGIDAVGEVELTPAMVKGRVCYVFVDTEKYDDLEGNIKARNIVVGYRAFHSSTAGEIFPRDENGNFPYPSLES